MTGERSLRVILADDEPHIRLLLKTMLASMHFEVVGLASDGMEALSLYRAERPDLLLLDINMPRMNGMEALEALMAEFPEARVIMLTSVSDSESVEHCIDLGAVNFIRKDTPLPEMKAIIAETLKSGD